MKTYPSTRVFHTRKPRGRTIGWTRVLHRAVAAASGFACGLLLFGSTALADEPGKELFKTQCGACHTVGAGKLVGPDLRGVTERRDEAWLLKFIKSSQSMVKSGDPVAAQLFDEFNKVMMPDQPISEDQIKQILAWMTELDAAGESFSLAASVALPATPENIALGSDLFQGKVRFDNGGPSCVSCHDVKNDAVIGGGILAKELTNAFSTVGGAGVQAILGSPPFPVMEQAYTKHPLTTFEIGALVVFLQDADANKAFQQPRDYGVKLMGSGAAGMVVLMGFYGLLWRRRKKVSVNDAIYARQVRSR